MPQYNINNLGTFTNYTPASGDTSKGYAKRSDGKDFYDVVNDPTSFQPNSLKLLCTVSTVFTGTGSATTTTVSYASFDATDFVLQSYNSGPYVLIEVLNYVGYKTVNDFVMGTVNVTTGVITPYAYAANPGTYKLGFAYKRATDTEAATIEMILSSLSLREKRVAELTDLSLSSPVFQTLSTQFVNSFGQARAQVLLAQVELTR